MTMTVRDIQVHTESYRKGFADGLFDGRRDEDLRVCGRSCWAEYGDGYAAGWAFAERERETKQ